MKGILPLRQQAKENRDKAIKQAHRAYEAMLAKIAVLERHVINNTQPIPKPKRVGQRRAVVRADFNVKPPGALTLAESMQSVLRTHGTLSKLEICVYVLELGYKTTMTRHELMSYSGKLLRTRPHLFKREAGKWTLVG